MANNGYISSSGIDQTFTTGPYSGSIVTSSYSSGSVLNGPNINFNQPFISGSDSPTGSVDYDPSAVNILSPCGTLFQRYFNDPINCLLPVSCIVPTMLSAEPVDCGNPRNKFHWVYLDSGSIDAEKTIIEFSTYLDFSQNTGSLTVINPTSSIQISTLSLPVRPFNTQPLYIRAFNSCSIGAYSTPSNIVTSSCFTPYQPPILPFNVVLKNTMTGSISTSNQLFYTYQNQTYSISPLDEVTLTILDGNPLSIPFWTNRPENEVYKINLTDSTFNSIFNGNVSSTLTDNTPSINGTVIQSTNFYPHIFYYNTEGQPDAYITVDRSNWDNGGEIEFEFTTITPSNSDNPWSSYYNQNQGLDFI